MKLTTTFTILNPTFNEMDLIRDAMKKENWQLKDCMMIIEKCIKLTNLLINL